MSGSRAKIKLPGFESRSASNASIERPSSRTDQLVEASFSSDLSPLHEMPTNSNSLKSMPSVNKLREILAQTSEKLNNYTEKHGISNTYAEITEKNKEITELRKKLQDLETEK